MRKIPKGKPTPKLSVYAGHYDQAYSNGHHDSTDVECNGNVKWYETKKLSGKMYPAGSGLPADRAAQNNNPIYQAADGWFFRTWDRATAWEFVKFDGDQMIVRHFCAEKDGCRLTSPEGSGGYCCGSTSKRQPTACKGTFQ